MRWKGRRGSRNVEDRRAAGPGKVALGGGGIVTLLIVMGIVWAMGGNPFSVLSSGGGGNVLSNSPSGAVTTGVPQDEQSEFMKVVLADTEEVWTELFREARRTYSPPTLVFYTDSVQSGCGFASDQIGPFYCPADQKIYIDLTFFEQLASQLGAPGDFAQAYVLAHEVGHHVQHQLGATDRVHSQKGRISEAAYNDLSVRLELQADYYAGVWAHHAQKEWNILEEGDIEEAIRAASAVGDDTLQKRSQGHVVPDSFTHGTSAQRMKWFMKGFRSGDPMQGDTFNIENP